MGYSAPPTLRGQARFFNELVNIPNTQVWTDIKKIEGAGILRWMWAYAPAAVSAEMISVRVSIDNPGSGETTFAPNGNFLTLNDTYDLTNGVELIKLVDYNVDGKNVLQWNFGDGMAFNAYFNVEGWLNIVAGAAKGVFVFGMYEIN